MNNVKMSSSEERTEIDFISPCPVSQCINNEKSYRWTHKDCGGREKLSVKGMLRCLKCGTDGKFVDWKFNCGDHDYLPASKSGVIHALTIMSQLAKEPEEQKFITDTTLAIIQQFKNYTQ